MLIKQTTQDSDPSSNDRVAAHVDQKIKVNPKAGILLGELVPVFLVLFVPFFVHAGFFTTLMNVLNDEEETLTNAEIVSYSATETPLLSAITNPVPKAATGGGDVTVDDGALVSTGPVGEDEIANSDYKTGEIRVYTVGEGDTLSQIAQMYGVTTNTVLWANDLSSAKDIHPGDTLVILPIVGVQHEVKDGETLSKIVAKYDADAEEVLAYNHLSSSDDISVGDKIIIPGGEIAAPKTIAYATPVSTSGSVSGGSGSFVHPAPGSVRTQGIHGYNAVDLAASNGTPIRAAASGEVIVSKQGGWNGGYGNYIVVKHANGTQTLYAHLSQNYVGAGAWVGSGETIGAMGNTGRSTGTHLHFEVRGASNPF